MKTREEALEYGLSFPDTYTEMPFHDPNWQLVRVKGSKKAFLWTYEKDVKSPWIRTLCQAVGRMVIMIKM